MSKVTTRPLGDLVIEAQSGFASGAKSDDGVAQIRMNNITIDGSLDMSSIRRVPWNAVSNINKYLLNDGDILFNSTNSPNLVGKSARFVDQGEPFTFSNHFVRLTVDPKQLDSRYLARWLTLQQQRGVFELLCTQWVNQASVRKEDLLAQQIPFPPLAEQKRIATILDQADALRGKRRATLARLDALVQSLFLEMFGDPVRNLKQWQMVSAIDVCDCIVPGRDKPKSFTGTTPWVTTEDLVFLGITYGSTKGWGLSQDEIEEVRARVIPAGSVLMTCVGDLGITSVAGRDMVVNQQLHSFQCSPLVNNIFLMYSLSYQKPYMYRMATSTTVPYMNKTVCNSVPTILPPLDMQVKFADFLQTKHAVIVKHKQYLSACEVLFHALQQRAFRGDL